MIYFDFKIFLTPEISSGSNWETKTFTGSGEKLVGKKVPHNGKKLTLGVSRNKNNSVNKGIFHFLGNKICAPMPV